MNILRKICTWILRRKPTKLLKTINSNKLLQESCLWHKSVFSVLPTTEEKQIASQVLSDCASHKYVWALNHIGMFENISFFFQIGGTETIPSYLIVPSSLKKLTYKSGKKINPSGSLFLPAFHISSFLDGTKQKKCIFLVKTGMMKMQGDCINSYPFFSQTWICRGVNGRRGLRITASGNILLKLFIAP